MAVLQLAEYVIEAAVTKLAGNGTTTGVNARIDTINAERTDLAVGYPDIHSYGISPIPPGPRLVVTDGGTPEGSTFSAEGPHSFAYDFQLIVLCKDDDSDRISLGKRLLRLERAVIETLWDDAPREQLTVTVGASTNQPYINPARVLPGPIFNAQDDESLLSSFRIVVFNVTKREN